MEALEFQLSEKSRQGAAFQKAFSCASRAVALDDTDFWPHLTLAYIHLYDGHDCHLVRKHLDRALVLGPNSSDVLAEATFLWTMLGDAEEGVRVGRMALLLNPNPPDWYLSYLSVALFSAKQYAESLELRQRVPTTFVSSPFFGAALLAHMGRLDEAKVWASKAISILAATPGGAQAVAAGQVVERIFDTIWYCHQVDRDHFAEGMRKAGVPG
jgi:hypothetical protein